jgi:hypothetical protein
MSAPPTALVVDAAAADAAAADAAGAGVAPVDPKIHASSTIEGLQLFPKMEVHLNNLDGDDEQMTTIKQLAVNAYIPSDADVEKIKKAIDPFQSAPNMKQINVSIGAGEYCIPCELIIFIESLPSLDCVMVSNVGHYTDVKTLQTFVLQMMSLVKIKTVKIAPMLMSEFIRPDGWEYSRDAYIHTFTRKA